MQTKPCSKCKLVQPLDAFYADPRMKLGRMSRCKSCLQADAKAWRKANPERNKQNMRRWREKSGETLRAKKREYERGRGRDLRYGLAAGQYDGMYAAQQGCCGICGEPVEVLCVDHCHDSGAVRGLLCSNCNTGIGMLGDDIAKVRAALAYLEKHAESTWQTATADIEGPRSQQASLVQAA